MKNQEAEHMIVRRFHKTHHSPGKELVEHGLKMARDSEGGVWSQVVLVSPELAGDLLALNFVNNRTVSNRRIKRYADEMAKNEWHISNDYITFGQDGKMYNGQHRLFAVIEANTSVLLGFLYGVKEVSTYSMDTGYVRTQGNTLHVALGITNANQLAALANYEYRWANHTEFRTGHWQNLVLSREELVKTVKEREIEYREAIAATSPITHNTGINQSAVALAYMVLTDLNPERAEVFFDALASGANLSPKNPILLLRNKLIQTKGSRILTGGPHYQWEQFYMTLKAWNAWIKGKERTTIAMQKDEAIPVPIAR